MFCEDSGGVLSKAGLIEELVPFSFFRVFELGVSSGLVLMLFNGLATEEEDEDSLFLDTTPSPVFFFTLSLFTFTPSVLTLAFTF